MECNLLRRASGRPIRLPWLCLLVVLACAPKEPVRDLDFRTVGTGSGLLVVLLHGFGAKGDDLVGLSTRLAAHPDTRFILPEAPLEVGYGKAWWPMGRATDEKPSGLDASRAAVIRLLTNVKSDAPLVLGGFSQGAMLATEVFLHTSVRICGLMLFSGAIVSETRLRKGVGKLKGLQVFVSHGKRDRVLPFAESEALVNILRGGTAEVSFLPFDGGHTIPDGALSGAAALMEECRKTSRRPVP